MKNKVTASKESSISTEQKVANLKVFLIKNAASIQNYSTELHIKYLSNKSKLNHPAKYKKLHIEVIHLLAKNLSIKDLEKGKKEFRNIATHLAHEAVTDGLTIEETVDGTIFLKQAIWRKLGTDGLLNLTMKEYHELHLVIATYTDIVSSIIAFTFHKDRQHIEGNLRYLAESSKILSSSLDFTTTLQTVAKLAVPQIADWCVVDMQDAKKGIQQVALIHKDPKKIAWAKELRKRQPIDMNAKTGVPQVLRSGKPEIYPVIDDQMLKAVSKSKKELELARSIGFTSAMVVPIFSEKKPIGAITFVTTETRRHYNEADLRMAEELATRASVAIENAKLYKGSQEAITMRDDFISVASHELKTPVTSVKMFTQVLKKHSEQIGDTKAVSHLSKMDKQINKLTELIYDLLNVSKIQAGRMEFREELFDMDKAVQEVVDILQQSESKHKILIKGASKKKILGDEERIGQVINNLISNAIKYSPRADKVIIRLSSDTKSVYVEVQDYGIGMDKAHLERIFERFYRVYDTTDKTFPGLGIGLYISSEIIKRHGGKLWVESKPGIGSIFHFSVPIKKA